MSENIDKEDLGRVLKIEGDYAVVEMIKGGSCDSCAIHGFCGAGDKTIQHRIKTNLNLKPNDTVKVFIAPQFRLLSSFILFILPILAMIGFYFIGNAVFGTEGRSILTSLAGLLLCTYGIYIFDKKYASRKIKFEILGKIENAVSC